MMDSLNRFYMQNVSSNYEQCKAINDQSERNYQIKKHIEYSIACLEEPDVEKRERFSCIYDPPMKYSDIGEVKVFKVEDLDSKYKVENNG